MKKMAAVLGIGINSLPDNVILDIFSFLPVKDLCLIGRVCRRWRRITLDNKFWRHVDLRPYKLDLGKMWKVIRRHFSHVLLSLRLRGPLHRDAKNWSKKNISDAMLRDLQERCPKLQELEICDTNLSTMSVSSLPHNLHTLIIRNAFIPQGWFSALAKAPLPQLRHLDLSESTKLCNDDLKHLSAHRDLICLKINGCYRVSEEGLRCLAINLTQLTTLEIATCTLTDLACHHISRCLRHLQTLNLANCKGLTSHGLASLVAVLKNLQVFDVTGALYSQDLVQQLHSAQSLKVLHIRLNHIDNDHKEKLSKALPTCDITF